jgi:DNA-directed RNA polymerase specialized sigma24 family protein
MAEDFVSWYERTHSRLLAAVTVLIGDVALAEDVVAEAFARALERWDRVKDMDSPAGWAYQVALNAARRARRRQAFERRVLAQQRPVDVTPPPGDPDLWAAVWALPPRQRQAIALRYVADLPEAEVASLMGAAPGTVAATLHQARRRLAERLGDTVAGELT